MATPDIYRATVFMDRAIADLEEAARVMLCVNTANGDAMHVMQSAIHRLTELGELDHAKALADALAKLEGK